MNESYSDITSRIAEPPLWWDEQAVPRYEPFEPRMLANIYARECVLMLIKCQDCGTPFKVALSRDATLDRKVSSLAMMIADDTLHYGDPPNTSCCAAGPTMNSVPCEVLEYWISLSPLRDWQRVADLEVPIRPDWWTA